MSKHDPSKAAVVILVPEAEVLVAPFRERYDRSSAQGMPAHITLLYPFRPAAGLGPSTLAALSAVASAIPVIRFRLGSIRRFPGVLYLAPRVPDELSALTEAVWRQFPDSPPYSGLIRKPVPHLTVADTQPHPISRSLHDEIWTAIGPGLPVDAVATALTLMTLKDGRWQIAAGFPLATPPP